MTNYFGYLVFFYLLCLYVGFKYLDIINNKKFLIEIIPFIPILNITFLFLYFKVTQK